jgi:hypothetical protein
MKKEINPKIKNDLEKFLEKEPESSTKDKRPLGTLRDICDIRQLEIVDILFKGSEEK